MILGLFVSASIIAFFYLRSLRSEGFPELLPASATAVYVEFETRMDELLANKLNAAFDVDWNKEITEWAGEKSAFAFLSAPKNNRENELLPFLLVKTDSFEKALEYVKNHKNKNGQIKEIPNKNIRTFATAAVNFSVIGDTMIFAKNLEDLEILAQYQTIGHKRLDANDNFMKTKRNLADPQSIFLYAQPKSIPPQTIRSFTNYLPAARFFAMPFPAIGIAAEKTEDAWQGKSYAISETQTAASQDQAYRARLLQYLPPEADLLISGQNLAGQIQKTDSLSNAANAADQLPPLKSIIATFAKTYFENIDFDTDVFPLFSKEFAIIADGNKILVATETEKKISQDCVEKLRAAFIKTINGKLTPEKRDIMLPDNTKAQEWVPASSDAKQFQETFEGITINTLLFKDGNGEIGIFDAFAQDKLFIGNNSNLLRKALLLTKEPGPNFRESSLYRNSLQPILKNPELMGIGKLPLGTFSFSKRTHPDHMETDFRFVVSRQWRDINY